jgi:Ca-activated chloride channel family protein
VNGQWRHALVLTAAVCSGTLAAQTLPVQRQGPPLRSSVELTVVTATVIDAEGRLVPDLAQDAFEIFEDGAPQRITQFTHERVPLGLGLLLDVSDSMFGQRLLDARAAVERFLLELLEPTDAFFVMAFNHEPTLLAPWTSEPQTVRRALDSLRASGSTAIYDAVSRALPLVDHRPRERAALVVISDGADTASDITLRQLRTALQRSDAFVYAIAIDSPARYALNASVDAAALGEITNPTGGHTQVVHDTNELAAATARIADELNKQYMLGYSSPHPGDGEYHSIRVKVAGGYRVRARNGYVAVRQTGTKDR